MSTQNKLFSLIILFTLLVSACSAQGGQNIFTANNFDNGSADLTEPLSFTDDLGRTITFSDYPDRIVSASASITEMLFAIGADDLVVGVDDFSYYPAEAGELPSIGSFFTEVPAESILALEPDLVIVAEIISPENVQVMQELGLTVYWQANPKNFDDLYSNLTDLANLTGRTDALSELVSGLESRVGLVLETVSGSPERPRVFYELDGTDPLNPWTTGSGTFIDTIINMAGGENAASVLEGEYAQISTEVLVTIDPEVILLADFEYGISIESVAARAGWAGMAAVENDRVFPFDPSLLSVPGTRLVIGLEELARLIHPELFK